MKFVMVTGDVGSSVYGPFWSARSVRRWVHEREERELDGDDRVVVGRWRRRGFHSLGGRSRGSGGVASGP